MSRPTFGHPSPTTNPRTSHQTPVTETLTRATPKYRKPKPDAYKLARIIKPAIKGCFPSDIVGDHPVYYSPTMTFTLANGHFRKISMTVKTSKLNLARIHFRGDYGHVVTQADLDQRRHQVAACIKKRLAKLTIRADSPQRRAAGKLRFSFSSDGIAYGINNL